MRIEACVTSISWIPSEAVTGLFRVPLDVGLVQYDPPPPDVIANLTALRESGRFRFANELRAWVNVEEGRVVNAGYAGQGHICPTKLWLGGAKLRVQPRPFPDLRTDPVVETTSATFRQTTGGRTGAPMPRRLDRPPYIRISSPVVWTTLELTVHADGSSDWSLIGASKMPRHWIYDTHGRLVAKSGTIEFDNWIKGSGAQLGPWGDADMPPAHVVEAETALERTLSLQIMKAGTKPEIRKHPTGTQLTTQGSPGDEMFLVLDGELDVEVDGVRVAEVGPGSLVGERSILESGVRTSTLKARTPVTVAVIEADSIDPAVLELLAEGHDGEDSS